MPTKRAAGTALFLFAHQDDEYGVFQAIEDSLQRGRRVACAYLTEGAAGSGPRRNAESLAVLAGMGVDAREVAFAGDRLAIVDGTLPRHMAAAGGWLRDWLASFDDVELICVTAWEGGHHDHDALHFLAAHAAEKLGLLARLRQYSLYNALGRRAPWFNVLAPLAANGAVERTAVGWGARARHLGRLLRYPSQWKTWVGLFPFVLWHYLRHGSQQLQPVALARLAQRPHDGPLYYEQRRFYTWEAMQQNMAEWLAHR
ncbi:PIG-L family deacetylase [Rugamonas sp. FT107W]|uniref:PIG-L family deacetylase n=1 Tax=Duganella vulcania TaxID=2692166 RepID=A0A845HQA7_9BURK|nr:PIG-L family deacetylase [Duganella vulcania]MYN19685.1 PIG-L family deacetylase [Duganella vulcania]